MYLQFIHYGLYSTTVLPVYLMDKKKVSLKRQSKYHVEVMQTDTLINYLSIWLSSWGDSEVPWMQCLFVSSRRIWLVCHHVCTVQRTKYPWSHLILGKKTLHKHALHNVELLLKSQWWHVILFAPTCGKPAVISQSVYKLLEQRPVRTRGASNIVYQSWICSQILFTEFTEKNDDQRK